MNRFKPLTQLLLLSVFFVQCADYKSGTARGQEPSRATEQPASQAPAGPQSGDPSAPPEPPVIAGRLVDEAGDPVPNATVAVVRQGDPSGQTIQTTANDIGHYAFADVTPGTYSIRAAAPGASSPTLSVTAEAGKIAERDLQILPTLKLKSLWAQGHDEIAKYAQTRAASDFPTVEFSRGTAVPTRSIFFITDRPQTGSTDPSKRFGPCDPQHPAPITVGTCDVTQGAPYRIVAVHPMDHRAFVSALVERTGTADARRAFMFVHGYNNTFVEAMVRTATLEQVLDQKLVPICYSWPSTSGLSSYETDERAAEATVPVLREWIAAIADAIGSDRLDLVSHSLGARTLKSALLLVGGRYHFANIVLAAADISRNEFRNEFALVTALADRTTLYAASNDWALWFANWFDRFARIGDAHPPIALYAGVDTVDVSEVNASLFGHGYIETCPFVLADIRAVLLDRTPPGARPNLTSTTVGAIEYWTMHGH